MKDEDAASSAIRKLDKFYDGLEPDERKVIATLVGASVQRAARAQAERDWLEDGEILLKVITPDFAPTLVTDLGTFVAGQAAPVRADKRPFL